MMRRRVGVALLAGVLLAGLVAVPGSPAGAQNGTDLLDLPRLGFEIDHHQGYPGDVVGAQVDPDDVAEHCLTALDIYDAGPPESGDLLRFGDTFVQGYYTPAVMGERPIPGGLSSEEFEEALTPLLVLLLAVLMDPDNLLALWENMFVLTFVEPATTEMVGPMGGFDPISGEGEIVVPELDPGLYAIAAACVGLMADEELLAEGGAFDQITLLLHEWITINYPDGPPPLGFPPSEEFTTFVLDAATVWVPEAVEPLAIGIEFYCILQPDGFCATPPGPVGLIDDDVLDEFNGDDPLAPGSGAEDGEDVVDGGDLVAVQATPSFTG